METVIRGLNNNLMYIDYLLFSMDCHDLILQTLDEGLQLIEFVSSKDQTS